MLNLQNIDLPHNWDHVHLPETDSTMLLLRLPLYQHSDKEFILATTDYQTAGRGQRGNHWEAERGKNLLFGFLFHPTLVPVTHQFALSEALALAVRAALAEHVDGGVKVKWPNDVYWLDYKIAGMLLEHDVCGTQIATTLTGVGINVNQTVFESDAPNPISLMKITGNHHSRAELLSKLVGEFEKRYHLILHNDYATLHTEYMEHLYRGEGDHVFEDASGKFAASIEGISPLGILSLRKSNGTICNYAFKEVAFCHDEQP